ncbi:HlyD family secretion protein [Roseomonas sp. OT10]|uniref:HlyD family secretion protein n=1 Tax=Roseomonas cutis TaxID=2897332 RepID=UPI001E2C5AD1|nr:HlyD family secretion protein [Roseomonas sp. OT10]UFN51064.1 HlyD family secretion protein [Roseomonas sp. OT10]
MSKALKIARTAGILLIGCAGALLVLHAWQLPPFQGSMEVTENAYVRGQVTVISPQLAGYVTEVPVRDFQRVRAGQVLVQIDDRIFRQKQLQAQAALAIQRANLANSDQNQRAAEARIRSGEAQVTGARATLDTAEANARRVETLLSRGISTQSAADQSRATLAQATAALHQAEAALQVSQQDLQSIIVNRQSQEAGIASAEAALRLAEIDLQNTRILAPQDGQLGEIGVRLGQYVTAGTQLAALVPERKWVVANFKENQLYGMRRGQPVRFTVDALQNAELTGQIEAFSPATGSEFSVLRADNATGNFTKVAQRLPVRIAIDADQPLAQELAPGMSVVVTVDTATAPRARTAASLDPAQPDDLPRRVAAVETGPARR